MRWVEIFEVERMKMVEVLRLRDVWIVVMV